MKHRWRLTPNEAKMARLIVITDPDTALGFRLAGVEVIEVTGAQQAAGRLLSLRKTKDAGVVIYNEDYRRNLSDREQVALDESVAPIFFSVPVARTRQTGEARADYLARLLRRAIGYQLKIKR